MTKNGKITKRENITSLLNHTDLTQNERDYLENELALLDRKNATSKVSAEEEAANNALRSAILDGMEENRLYTATEISNEIEECKNLSTSKITSLLRALLVDGMVTNEKSKGKSYYKKSV